MRTLVKFVMAAFLLVFLFLCITETTLMNKVFNVFSDVFVWFGHSLLNIFGTEN